MAMGVAPVSISFVFRRAPLLKGGEGVLIGAEEETAVVADEVEGTLSLAGVEKLELSDPRDISWSVPVEDEEWSALALRAADMALRL